MVFLHENLEKAGHRVDFINSEDLRHRLKSYFWERFTFPLLVAQRAREAAARGEPYDIINVHEPHGVAIVLARRRAGRPFIVVTSHGVEERAWRLALEELKLGRSGPSLRSRLIYPLTSLWQTTFSLRHADHVFCLNGQDKDFLVSELKRDPTTVTRIFPGASPVYARKLDRNRPPRKLLFAGTWRKNKGIEDMVPAFDRLAKRHPELELVIVGGGVPEEEIRSHFCSDLRKRISCFQTSGDEENSSIHAACDVFVLPSLFEGTPLTLIEAMASGLPIVTTNVCGMKDAIVHEKNGLLIPIRSPDSIVLAVERLLEDESLRRRIGAQAQSDALEKYGWSTSGEHVQVVYEQMIKRRRP